MRLETRMNNIAMRLSGGIPVYADQDWINEAIPASSVLLVIVTGFGLIATRRRNHSA